MRFACWPFFLPKEHWLRLVLFLLLDVPGVNVRSSQDTKKCVKTFKKK